MESSANRNTATLMQLSAYGQYIFPFGNFIFPTVIWSLKKDTSAFIDYNGKQILNFQLSVLMYSLILVMIALPLCFYSAFTGLHFSFIGHCNLTVDHFNISRLTGAALLGIFTLFLVAALKVLEFVLILYAAVKNSNGLDYNFPLTIKFIK